MVPVNAPVKPPGIVQRHPELRWLASVVLIVAVIAVLSSALSGVFRDESTLHATGPEQLVAAVRAPHLGGYTGTILAKVDLDLPRGINRAIAQELPVGGSLINGSHTMRYWYGGPDRQRVAVLEQNAEQDVFRAGDQELLWDTITRTFERRVHDGSGAVDALGASPAELTPPQLAERILSIPASTSTTTLRSGESLLGRPTYELVVVPSSVNSMIASVHIQIDGRQAVPLGVQIYPRGEAKAAVDVAFTNITYGAPEDRNFTFAPPAGATAHTGSNLLGLTDSRVIGSGWLTVLSCRATKSTAAAISALFGSSTRMVKGRWGRGRVFSVGVLSVLVTSKARVLVGAVSPKVLYAAAGK